MKQTLRFALNRLLALILRQRAVSYSADAAAVALVLAPHQDDEVLGCGGLITLQRLDGRELHVAYITDGSASHPGHPTLTPAALSSRRVAEARTALRTLGVETPAIHFLGMPDGSLDKLTDRGQAEAVDKIARLLDRVQPDVIFIPYRRDGSSEHEAAFRLFQAARLRHTRPLRVLEFPVWAWWSPRLLVRTVLRARKVVRVSFSGYEFLKAEALAAYRSQVEPTPPWTHSILPADFCRMFARDEEFYFEVEP